MFSKSPASSQFLLGAFFCFSTCVIFNHGGRVQSQVIPTTDPAEVAALNSIFTKWNITSSMSQTAWNTSGTGDPCSGNATLPLSENINFRDNDIKFNPAILCDCEQNNTCHIVRIKATNLKIDGTIPDELKELKFLNNLHIGKNHLTGPLPPFIGNLSEMLHLNIADNFLSGSIPEELGNLRKLISFDFGWRNNFSGPLPPELGNMTNLEQMTLNSNGFEGEIPRTLVKLQKLKNLYISDNNFVGKVPDIFGNLTNLKSLWLEGNSFHGPIPSSFANLVQLTDLRLVGVSNSSSKIGFIRNMKSLEILILRDCMISDTIPEYIGQLLNLKYLDLSFNNLRGQLPPSLFNLEKLETLHLGNNSLSGKLPDLISPGLATIDLSYNKLSGRFPQWVLGGTQGLNLVANNFEIDTKRFPRALKCLQRDIPCSRGSPNYSSFAINCGGNETVTSNATIYERDDQNVSGASYYMTSTQRWAVSSVGTFVDNPDPNFVLSTSTNISNTDPVLSPILQSARLSGSSLRYYGIGLQNGNYTVVLHFAEIQFPDDRTWFSFGRRVFDIYVQGIIVEKDLEIKKEAGGRLFRATKTVYTSIVTDNFLEIHFFWTGKGTCCIPSDGVHGPLISAISVTPNFIPTVNNQPPNSGSSSKKKKALIAGLTTGFAILFIILVIGLRKWKRRNLMGVDEELSGLRILPHIYIHSELKKSTNDFSDANKLGEGGFGAVFMGKFSDGKIVAVKQLRIGSHQGKEAFVAEISAISAVKHRNLVNLYGCCYKGDKRLIVYEYMENGSLDQALHGKSGLCLDWATRFMICLGTARGLSYLHEESRYRIIHRDIKSSNILLDSNFNPKISDFGLARLYDDEMTHISTRVAGTLGYLAPEYAMRGHLTEKVDVFSFGIVALEVLSGRPSLSSSSNVEDKCLLEWAWELHEGDRDVEMLDPKLSTSYNKEEALRLIGVALLCTQVNHILRPSMSRVVAMLVGDTKLGDIPSKPTYMSDFHSDELSEKGESSSGHLLYGLQEM